ncbi:allantoin permease [Planosporangium flavigriseum]|uniref:Transporter membrane subunit n=1 Tax=Planosporangium flavigriseum TaxID=373681 RepID=A0A8J3LNT4_9ACTN|nr:cytosine permease [Planosporangium flavigriseum]NJC66079.1 allantoin permease [Planosporangium flavigriseum]GIG75112.1 transporter membrane subunit [Planosporangium flavigriseum]
MTSDSTSSAPVAAPLIEVRSIDWVPDEERHGRLWHQAPLWFLGNFQYFSIPIGFIGPAMGLSLGWTALAGALGIVIGSLFMAFHASQGPTLGLPQMIQSRAQFGYRGVLIPLFATFFTYLAFNVTDQVLLGVGLNSAFGWNATLVSVVVTVGAVLLAIFGHDWVHKAFRALLYVSLPLMTIVTIGIMTGHGGGAPSATQYGFSWVAFMAQLAAAAAYNITYAPYVSDYSRYLPSSTKPKSVIASVFFGASGSAIWLIILGGWLAIRLGADDPLTGLQTAGNNVIPHLGQIVALLSALALAATMGMNAYGGMLTVLTAVDSIKPIKPTRAARVVTILIFAVVWFAIGKLITADAVSTVTTALALMLYLLVPWTAANLVDFFIVRRGHYAITELFKVRGLYGTWNWRGLTAYAIGIAAEIPFMVLLDLGGWKFVGPLAEAMGEVDIAWLVGLAVTGVAYVLLSRSLDLASEQRAEAESDRELSAAHPGHHL